MLHVIVGVHLKG